MIQVFLWNQCPLKELERFNYYEEHTTTACTPAFNGNNANTGRHGILDIGSK